MPEVLRGEIKGDVPADPAGRETLAVSERASVGDLGHEPLTSRLDREPLDRDPERIIARIAN